MDSRIIRPLIVRIYAKYEENVCKDIDGVISVTPIICDRFRSINENTELIANYPNIDNLTQVNEIKKSKNAICYIGGCQKTEVFWNW